MGYLVVGQFGLLNFSKSVGRSTTSLHDHDGFGNDVETHRPHSGQFHSHSLKICKFRSLYKLVLYLPWVSLRFILLVGHNLLNIPYMVRDSRQHKDLDFLQCRQAEDRFAIF